MKTVFIQSRPIGKNNSCFIIAEAGVNHNGDFSMAKKLVDTAVKVGADAIKFQTYKAERFVSENAHRAVYQTDSTGDESQLEMLKKYELSDEEFKELADYANSKGIVFLSTPFDIQSAELLHEIGVGAFKIGSGDLTDLPLLKKVASWGTPMIISTGMSTIEEIEESLHAVKKGGCNEVILLHCTSSYPVRPKDANISLIPVLRDRFNLHTGFSDHTKSTVIPAAAVALGAVIIEKHFTLDNDLPGPDHKMSLNSQEFREMIDNIREIEVALGDGVKKITEEEKGIMNVARKSIVAAFEIPKNTVIIREMLSVKRPGTGLPPCEIDKIIGKKTIRKIQKDSLIKWVDLQ